jgi:hypothetical protein
MVEHPVLILPALIFVSLLLGNLTSRLVTTTNKASTTITFGSSSEKNGGSIIDDETRFYDLSSFNADEKRSMAHMAYILSVHSDTINWSELNRNYNIEHNNVESISVTVHNHKRRWRERSDSTMTDDILPSSLITSSVELLPTEQSSHLRTSLRRQMNHQRQLQGVLSTTATPTTVPVAVVDGATTSAPSSSVVVETTRPPRRTRRPRPSRPATTAPVTGSGTVVPGTTTSPPVIGTVPPGGTTTTNSPVVSIGTGAPGTSPPVVTTTLPPAGQSTTTTTAPTIAGTISTQEGDDDGLENSGTDEVGTGNNNEVDKGEITEVIEDVLEQWEDVTDDRFVTNPNTNEIMNDDENDDKNEMEDDETNVEIDDDDDDDDEKEEINQDSSDEQDGSSSSSSSSSNSKVDGDVFDGYEYKKGSNCQQSTDNDGVPCAPTNLQSLCNKYDRNNGSFRDCLNACKPAFCK